jgi:hypothetical protein
LKLGPYALKPGEAYDVVKARVLSTAAHALEAHGLADLVEEV